MSYKSYLKKHLIKLFFFLLTLKLSSFKKNSFIKIFSFAKKFTFIYFKVTLALNLEAYKKLLQLLVLCPTHLGLLWAEPLINKNKSAGRLRFKKASLALFRSAKEVLEAKLKKKKLS
jgi:hypothetical protein